MKKREKDYLPQSEAEWLATGKFTTETVSINGQGIKCALTQQTENCRLVVMAGGIPRDPERRRKLPLINKLYGYLAMKMPEFGIVSVLYNQPATGGSDGEWEKETLHSRSQTLAGITNYFRQTLSASDIALIGTSAGAYLAVNAAAAMESTGLVSKLVLLSPAAYPAEIENVAYGKKFTQLIRTPWDIATSPVFSKLEKFTNNGGSLLISFFEADDPPIPEHVQTYYQNFARHLSVMEKDVTILTIPGVAHNFRKIGAPETKNIVDNDGIRATANRLSEFLR